MGYVVLFFLAKAAKYQYVMILIFVLMLVIENRGLSVLEKELDPSTG